MALYELGGFRFHTILDGTDVATEAEITDLGEWMSEATARTKHLALKDAQATLAAYLSEELPHSGESNYEGL